MASPFHAASTLSSRAGCGRSPRRARSRSRRVCEPRGNLLGGDAKGLGELVVGDDPRQDRDAFPVACLGDPVRGLEQRRVLAEHLGDLGRPPGERQALDAFGVGVLARGERAVGRSKLAEHVVQRSGRDRAIPRVTGQCPSVHVHARQLGVVVQHLLEVRNEPLGVRRVAMEAATELVVHPAVGHRVKRPTCHRERPLIAGGGVAAQQELDRHRLRELRRPAPAAICRVERRLDRGSGRVQQRWRRIARTGSQAVALDDARDELAARRLDACPVARARPATLLRGPAGTTASRAGARPGSRSRRRTGARRASGRPTSASRRHRSSPGRRPCRPDRGRAAPRGRPSPRRSGRSGIERSARARTISRSMTWHQWQAAYPMHRKIGRSSNFARASASGPHGNQSTGLCVLEQVRARSPRQGG